MKYQVILEFDPETRHYTATVAGLPNIIVDATRQSSAIKMAREAIALYISEAGKDSPASTKRPYQAKVVAVEV